MSDAVLIMFEKCYIFKNEKGYWFQPKELITWEESKQYWINNSNEQEYVQQVGEKSTL